MSSEMKAFASLSSGLLARKGSARPAMRRQGFESDYSGNLDDCGWDDMGEDAHPTVKLGSLNGGANDFVHNPFAGLTPSGQEPNYENSPVHEQQAELAAHFAIPKGEEADDGADLEDETAELWDPEAEEFENSFTHSRAAEFAERAEAEEEAESEADFAYEAEEAEDEEEPVHAWNGFAAANEQDEEEEEQPTYEVAAFDIEDELDAEEEPLELDQVASDEVEEPVLKRTVADIVRMPSRQPIEPAPEAVAPRRSVRPRAEPGSKGKAAFTLRLDQSRHLKLRLASALTGRSAQKMLIDALDKLLAEMPEVEQLAEVGKKAS